MVSVADTKPSTTKLELRTAYGPVFRDVLNVPPRDCTSEEIPIIDLKPLYSDNLEDRKALASRIKASAVNTGFFYIKNHGISEEIIANARKQLLMFVILLAMFFLIIAYVMADSSSSQKKTRRRSLGPNRSTLTVGKVHERQTSVQASRSTSTNLFVSIPCSYTQLIIPDGMAL
jgi:hypothetical protein